MNYTKVDKDRIVTKAKEALGAISHPDCEDTWREVHIGGEVFDCNIFSRKELLEQEDDEPDVVADIYPTIVLNKKTNYRDTDTSIHIGRFYPEIEK